MPLTRARGDGGGGGESAVSRVDGSLGFECSRRLAWGWVPR
uniref:Uncharacterized protein n=1 Tax=Arundo donax TaxID=35708 RepID=A0A0A9C263_ARUDO